MIEQETRPEPSRLEIAAMLIAGSSANNDVRPYSAKEALKIADELIKEARISSLKAHL
jgi:hypothetical protein